MQFFIYLSAAISVAGFLYSARSLRRLCYLLFFFSLIEGAYINYFYPSRIVLLLKDFLVAYMYVLLVAQGYLRGSLRRTGALVIPIVVYASIYTVHVFNPHLNNVLVGLVGLRVAIFYIPLILVGQAAFTRREEMWSFLRFAVLLTIPVCIYGLYQHFGGPAHIASLGPGYAARGVASLMGAGENEVYSLRTLSTFTYSSSFSIFVVLMAPFAWILFRGDSQRRWQVTALVGLLTLFAAQISSGGRQALVFTAMGVLLTEILHGRGLVRKVVAPMVVGLGILVGFFVLGSEKISRFETIFDMQQVRWRWETYFIEHNLRAIEASPLGNGSGAASTAARHVGAIKFAATETALSKTVYEVGIPGFLAYCWILLALLRRTWRARRGGGDRRLALFARAFFALGVIVFATSFSGWPLDLPPMNALFWAMGGLVFSPAYLAARRAAPTPISSPATTPA